MAPPRKHATDDVLDAARSIVLAEGPRAASVAAIASASGAPAGTLYHRFGSRDGVLIAVWLRSLERFQARCIAAAAAHADPLEAGVAMAVSAITFARELPEDARLLVGVRPEDLLDRGAEARLRERLEEMNAPLLAEMRRLARGLHGRAGRRELDAVARAVADLPYATVRRHARRDGRLPGWLEADMAAAARALLGAGPRGAGARHG